MKIKTDYLQTVNYALYHNKIPVMQTLDLTNDTDHSLDDVRVVCEGMYLTRTESTPIARMAAGETVRVSRMDIAPDIRELAAMTERLNTTFTLSVLSGDDIIYKEEHELELMPYDHWLGTTILPQTLVSFMTPNHPSVGALVVSAAAELKALTGSSVLTAYQSGSVGEVRAQVAAVFKALHKLGIVYRSVPASYEQLGQRITMPDQVVSSKIGNCLELTLLMATVLEAVGINTVLIMQRGHAYLGVWLVDDTYPCSVCDDAAYVEKKCARGIEEMMVLECTQVAQEQASFEVAMSIALHNLADHSLFEMFIDVKRSRLERILPLPARVQTAEGWGFDTSGVEHDGCLVNLRESNRYDLSQIVQGTMELTKYDIWERKLLDFSLRNSLLNLSVRRRAVQFISFDVDRIEDQLQSGKEYCIGFRPNMELSLNPDEKIVRSLMHEQLRPLVSNDIDHHTLHTYQTEGETRDVLKNIYRGARNAIEETGANSLFLAIGLVRWYETEQSDTPRYAPLLLLPVEMVYKKGDYYIRTRDEEITLNITLMEFLRQNYGVTAEMSPLPKDESGVDVRLIFTIVRDAMKHQRRWDVEEECVLGTFSFSKFLMWNDIHSHRAQLAENDVIGSLVKGQLTWVPEPITEDLKTADKQTSPADTALPVPVDSSQMAAVLEAGKCHSFILYGPPGTGKSQTITNIIANALYQGKRVLFVAEKMAALSVVQSRLAKIGLDAFSLELHSNKATKRHVLQQLEKALNVAHIKEPADFQAQADRIFEERKALIAYMNALHDTDPADSLSLFDCILRYEQIPGQPLATFAYDPALDTTLAAEGLRGVEELLGAQFDTVVKLVGQPSAHALCGLRLTRDMLTNPSLTASMLADRDVIVEQRDKADELRDTASLRELLLRDCSASLLEQDGLQLHREWREAKAKWFVARWFAKRSYLKRLRTFNPLLTEDEVEPLLNHLIDYQQKHQRIETLRRLVKQYMGTDTPADTLPPLELLDLTARKLQQWAAGQPLMRDWLHWSEYADTLRAHGMGCIVEAMESGTYTPSAMRQAYLKAMLRYKAGERIRRSDALATFEGMLFDDKVAAYKRLTEEFQLLTQKELYARLAANVPRITDNLNAGSEIGLLSRNIANGGRGLSMRDLFEQLPTLLPRLCPCMLMSPMSVAQYLDLKGEKFDLVVFDEASQMPTSEAVGAIARGKALVVVGDPKQMPPTSFFSSTNVDEDEAVHDDMESILEDCRALRIPSLQLSWHYRSRHESLIAFSNQEYYDSSLITFPSFDDQRTKVHHRPVQGFYDKGGKRQNRAEAEAIVKEIERRLLSESLRRQSIGVIAFSVVQQSLIEDLLQAMLDGNKALHDAADAMYEPIFVKNLENVQGDERDVILFSIGYGPDRQGRVSMNFGPLNSTGGERRLNVAVSRAREEMYVYSTLRSSDIDLRRSKARGVEGLKHFLQFAESQALPTAASVQSSGADTQLAEHIASALRQRGHEVHTSVGRSQFKVDVAIASPTEPGTYLLGLLLDGHGYRDTQTTRDREIVQPSVLGMLGWQVMRVWTVDWFNNPERVLQRIEERLEAVPRSSDNGNAKAEEPKKAVFDISDEELEEVPSVAVPYKACELTSTHARHMSDSELCRAIVAVEQPITFALLCRRFCALREVTRVTQLQQALVGDAITGLHESPHGTWWLSAADCEAHSTYRPNSGRDIADIPQPELIVALREALTEQVALGADALTLLAAKKLGFTRRGTNVDAALRQALSTMLSSGMVEQNGDRLAMK